MVQLNKYRLSLKLLYFQRVDLWTQKIKNVIRKVQWTERKRTKDTKLPHVQLQSIMQGLLIWFSVQVIFSNWGKIFFGGKLSLTLFYSLSFYVKQQLMSIVMLKSDLCFIIHVLVFLKKPVTCVVNKFKATP